MHDIKLCVNYVQFNDFSLENIQNICYNWTHINLYYIIGGEIMHLQESGEMYLESIFILSKKKPHVRAIDVSEYLGYSKPSVSRAMGLLKSGGFIQVDSGGFITLTEDGLEIANKIYERHTLVSEFLISIGVDPDIACADACKIEHVISDTSFEAIKKHVGK